MKIALLQPAYPNDSSLQSASKCLEWMSEKLQEIDSNQCDILILPEYSNCPGLESEEIIQQCIDNEGKKFLDLLQETVNRSGILIFAGVAEKQNENLMNRIVAFEADKKQKTVYEKIHLTDCERNQMSIKAGSKIDMFHWHDITIGFAICFDLYFPEYFATLASRKPDLIICPSYQRSETAERIRYMSQCRALDTGVYLARCSYSMGTDEKGGHSMVVSPSGEIIVDAKDKTKLISADINCKETFIKPASHGQPLVSHRDLITSHRRPDFYRHATTCKEVMPQQFPILCAHRGLSSVCPENTLPSFASAIAVNAEEIELDLWASKDEVPVVCHDPDLDRTTDRTGRIEDLDWREIQTVDAGIKLDQKWQGVKVPNFDEVVDLCGGRIGMNIHMKTPGPNDILVRTVCDMLRNRNLLSTSYIAGDEDVLEAVSTYAPEVTLCSLARQDDPEQQIECGIKYNCKRVQFGRGVTEEQIKIARNSGLICNLFYSDEPEDAKQYIQQGIDVILTNCSHSLRSAGIGNHITSVI